MNQDQRELLPCPFCGSPAEEYPDGDMEGFSIMCSGKRQFILFNGAETSCPLSTFGYGTREAAIVAWNTRAASEIGLMKAAYYDGYTEREKELREGRAQIPIGGWTHTCKDGERHTTLEHECPHGCGARYSPSQIESEERKC